MTNAELFNDPVEAVAHLPEVDPSKDYLSELVGEGKKFKDPGALALSAVHKDRHIAKLESELKAIRTDMNSRLSLEELVTKLSSQKPSDSGQPDDSGSNQNASATLTPEDLAKLVDERVSQLTAREQAKSNLNTVKATLKEAWGADFPSKLRDKAAELGVGEGFLNDLAATQPKAFLKLVEAEKTPSTQPTVKDTGSPLFGRQVDSSKQTTQPVSDAGFRGKSYYNKLRAESPGKFWDPKIQIEMNEMAMKDPEKYLNS